MSFYSIRQAYIAAWEHERKQKIEERERESKDFNSEKRCYEPAFAGKFPLLYSKDDVKMGVKCGLCKFYRQYKCDRYDCKYAHGNRDMNCSTWMRKGECHKVRCEYAHRIEFKGCKQRRRF